MKKIEIFTQQWPNQNFLSFSLNSFESNQQEKNIYPEDIFILIKNRLLVLKNEKDHILIKKVQLTHPGVIQVERNSAEEWKILLPKVKEIIISSFNEQGIDVSFSKFSEWY
jgi:hypothetical protein